MTTRPVIVGGTPESRAELQAEFAMSSLDWQRRSNEALARGDHEKAHVFAMVARVAASVAQGLASHAARTD